MKTVTSSGMGRPLVQLIGRFDAHETSAFRATVEPLLDTDGGLLTIDLSNVVFLDSTALAELLHLQQVAHGKGGDVTLLEPSDPVRVILEITGFEKVFTIEHRNDLESSA
jgi:anti-sigma B factor antagonist